MKLEGRLRDIWKTENIIDSTQLQTRIAIVIPGNVADGLRDAAVQTLTVGMDPFA